MAKRPKQSMAKIVDSHTKIQAQFVEPLRKSAAMRNLQVLHDGCELYKIQKKGKRYRRTFRMDPDFLTLRQVNTKKVKSLRKMIGQGSGIDSISLNEIQDVRAGPVSDVFTKSFERLGVKENQCFSIVYGPKHRTLDLVADDREKRDAWVNGMRHLLKKLSQADLITQQDIWKREMFKYADKNGDQVLSLKEVISLLKYLNIEVDHEQARTIFEAADTNKEKSAKGEDCLDMDEFLLFYQMLTRRPEVEQLFEKYNYEGKYLDPEELHDFMLHEEFIEIPLKECEKIISTFEPCPGVKAEGMMSIDGFNAFLNSAVMNIFDINHRDIYQDMSRPLSHYWIDSSHNTYLTADQLVGPSAVEAYIRALKRGCRCVELDVWDGPSGDPVIYHGHTLTSKITFKGVIECVNLYAFESSDYPVILSIENHCSEEQQKKMAKYLRSYFGDRLYDDINASDRVTLPSPEELKGKVIVKGKRLAMSSDLGEVSDEDEAADIDDENVKRNLSQRKKSVKLRLARELSDTVVICQSVGFKGFDYAQNNYKASQMSSFAEGKASSLVENEASRYVHHNQWQLSRIYPSGRRTDSSNYDPVPMWNCGCQIVALNYQTADDAMMIYKGRFRDNGGCGYVLKPSFLLEDTNITPAGKFNPHGPFPPEWRKKVYIKIISGYQLPKKKKDKQRSILDPYVKVDVLGVEVDKQSQRTDYIHNNGFNPVWDKMLEFTVSCPELALVWFQVMDYESLSSNVLVAQFCLPFTSMKQGYRHVPLHDVIDDQQALPFARLLIHVRILDAFQSQKLLVTSCVSNV